MSKLHVLSGTPEGDYQVAFHVTTPVSGTSIAGLTWAAAVAAAGFRTATAMVEGTNPWQITTAERASLAAGAIVEVTETINLANQTAAVVGGILDARWFILRNEVATAVRGALRFFGMVRV